MPQEYRREIDGLRAIAVISVIIFHTNSDWAPGGFIGVDVFFVISGYLISTILMRDLETGRFSIFDFYERRARRILPALSVVILCSIPVGWAWLLPLEMKDFSQSVLAAAFSVSNILFWLETDYFDTATELKPLLHTWSLGVEEQFYLFFPPALALLWRSPLRQRATVICMVTLASLGLCLLTVRDAPAAAFYLLPFRAWEVMFGALCALWHFRYGRSGSGALTLVGIVALLISITAFDKDTPFPSAYALVPVVGSCLILLFADGRRTIGRALGSPPCVGIGLISYSAYLWHQPLLAFGRIYAPDEPSQPALVALAAASLPLAYITWRFVEQPFRKRGPKVLVSRRAHVFSLSAAALVAAAVFGTWGHVKGGHPSRYTPQQAAFLQEHEWPRRCLFTRREPLKDLPVPACRFAAASETPRGRVALVGDSVMSSLSPALIAYFTAKGYDVEQFTHSHCMMTRHHRINKIDAAPCPEFISRVVTYIAAEGFDLVITAGAFQAMTDKGQLTLIRSDHARATPASFARDFKDTVKKTGARLLLVGPHPRPPVNVRDRAVRELRTHGKRSDFNIDRALYEHQVREIRKIFDVATPNGSLRVNPGETFCSGGSCNFIRAGLPLLSDRTHYSQKGAELAIMPLIDRELRAAEDLGALR